MSDSSRSLREFLRAQETRLRQADVDNPSLDARLLAGQVLGLDRAELLSQSHRILTPREMDAISMLTGRRAERESVARILGSREFWGLSFALNESTLEPRPDSECLVEAVLKQSGPRDTSRRVLDLGTGTGCLLLSLLHEWPNATGLGIDIAPRAVEQATANAAARNLAARAVFRTGNWLDNIAEKFDVIVSNPPYIPSADIPTLQPEVRDGDPLRALDGGEDGVASYRLLAPQLARFLSTGGLVAFEVGQGQAKDVATLLAAQGLTDVSLHTDLGGIERCVSARVA
jgi:release factor glutamine methyltransferase